MLSDYIMRVSIIHVYMHLDVYTHFNAYMYVCILIYICYIVLEDVEWLHHARIKICIIVFVSISQMSYQNMYNCICIHISNVYRTPTSCINTYTYISNICTYIFQIYIYVCIYINTYIKCLHNSNFMHIHAFRNVFVHAVHAQQKICVCTGKGIVHEDIQCCHHTKKIDAVNMYVYIYIYMYLSTHRRV